MMKYIGKILYFLSLIYIALLKENPKIKYSMVLHGDKDSIYTAILDFSIQSLIYWLIWKVRCSMEMELPKRVGTNRLFWFSLSLWKATYIQGDITI